jgi:hypothetical protein
MKRYILYGALLAAGIYALISNRDVFSKHEDNARQVTQQQVVQQKPALEEVVNELPAVPAQSTQPETSLEGTIKIATFNIQIFGESKKNKTEVMDVLTKTVKNFDVVAIQEVRDTNDDIVPYFVGRINELPEIGRAHV